MESIDCDTRKAAIRAGRLIDLGDAAPEHANSVAISRALYDRVADDPEAMAWILGAGFRGFETYDRACRENWTNEQVRQLTDGAALLEKCDQLVKTLARATIAHS